MVVPDRLDICRVLSGLAADTFAVGVIIRIAVSARKRHVCAMVRFTFLPH